MATNNDKPAIRFVSFTESWEQRKLKDFGKATGGTSIESEFCEGGKYKVISIGSYSEQSVYNDQGIRANETEKTKVRILNKNDLSMILNDKTASGNIIGRVLLIDADDSYVYNQRTEKIEVNKDQYVPKFLYQLLNADCIRSKIIKASQGNTQIYVNWPVISEIDYLVPRTKAEQEKIGDYFANLDNLITLHQRKYDKLVNVKKSMLEKMFPRNGKNIPEIRFTGFNDTWEQSKFCDITTRESKCDMSSENLPSVEYEDVIAEEGLLNKDVSLKEVQKRGIIFDGSQVLYGKLRPYLHNWLNPDFMGVAVGDWWVLKPINMNKNFIYSLIQTQRFDDVANQSTGSKMPRADWNLISETEFMVPISSEEQAKIGDYFMNLDHLITLHQRELEKLKNIKKSMLEKMFIQ